MKKISRMYLPLFMAALFIFSTCKKKDEPEPAPPPAPAESGQSSIDNREAQSETDIALSEINMVILDDARLRGRSASAASAASATSICGMSLDTAGIETGSITLNFNGTTCNNRTRTGTIKVAIQNYEQGQRWKAPGCVLQLQYVNYKVTRASDQKSIEFNGIQYITNDAGGTWWELLVEKSQASLVHSISCSNFKVKWSDNKTATYNINRRVTYAIPDNILTVTAEGTGTSNGLNNLENYGLTREGDSFTSQVNTPIVWNLTCGANAPVSGDVSVVVQGKGFTLQCLFGTDASGNPVTVGSNQCPYGWKLKWNAGGADQSRVIAYK